MVIVFEIKRLLNEFLQHEGSTAAIKFLDKRRCEISDLLIKGKTVADVHFDVELLQRTSAGWPLPVDRVSITGSEAYVWFERKTAFRNALAAMEWKIPVENHNNGAERLYLESPAIEEDASNSMTHFRAKALWKVMKNCFTLAGYVVLEKDTLEEVDMQAPVKRIVFVQRKNRVIDEQLGDTLERQHRVEILSGPVLVSSDLVDADNYIRRRSDALQPIAQQRYGVRIHDSNELERMVASLGRSAAIVDVLQQKHSSMIDMRVPKHGASHKQNPSKKATFILYNFARLVSIFKKYRLLMEQEGYPRMPPVDEVDFGLLTDREEWNLLFVYVIGFPYALRRTLGDGELARIDPHYLLEFTFGLVSCLSKYYCSTRILTDNSPKLLPVMIARLHLLQAIYNILRTLLHLLDLEPIENM
ncbi:DALR anticodon-binding domain-containing protein 3-like [Anopheles ziemanni]|uniref:DALR anticodon-binding domain-containing protein 3-like n=1 Tax=Anopheles coustani TaxID=139045 RepID=UPI0026584DEE|nr:DALR anticodon-binding domain-containing protein 3-like [Anopheles coustani]XP_058176177.1 DALR anticodon-binding domain-containing protein 3-like [Anopheles ziemanni]